MRVPALAAFAAALLSGCGPGVDADADDSTDTDPSGSSSTASGSSGGTTGDTCASYEPVEASVVTLRVRNDRATPIFIDQRTCDLALELVATDGSPLAWRPPSCGGLQCHEIEAGYCDGECGACEAGVTRLEAGKTLEVQWRGTLFVEREIPPACRVEACQLSCAEETVPEAGAFTLRAGFFDTCPLAEPESCECPAADPTGACFLPLFGEVSGALATAEVMFELGEAVVEVVVD